MKRNYGTCIFGVRTPIIEQGDDLVKIVVDSTLKATKQLRRELADNDIVGVTEAVVAMSQGNYANLEDIGADVRKKFGGGTIGIVHPILSRNRFQNILKGIARGAEKVYVLLGHVDEQGNALSKDINVFKPDTKLYTATEYVAKYGKPEHAITKQDYMELYIKSAPNVEVLVCSDPAEILKFTKNVIIGCVHSREAMKEYLKDSGAEKVYTLAEILSSPVGNSGFNPAFGVLGSNYASSGKLKLFPRNCDDFVKAVQAEFKKQTGTCPEVMIFADGAYKDPDTGIWELADPVVSPGFTKRLGDVGRGDTKLKNIVDDKLATLPKEEKEKRLNEIIAQNNKTAGEGELGTTPRRLVNLVGSAMDLTSGSGNKGTPVVLIQGYFDSRSDE